MGDQQSIVAELGGTGYATELRARTHVFASDEPTGAGGTDTGPTPYEFLAASLASCTAMTLRMYADRKAWSLTGVRVAIDLDRIHASDCDDCESSTGQVLRMTRHIKMDGDLDDAQRTRLLEIADRCPVHRTLKAEIQIITFAQT